MHLRYSGKACAIAVSMAAVTAVLFSLATRSSASSPRRQPGRLSARIAGKPDFSGIWEANNTANWDLQTHEARPMVAQPGLTPGSVVLAAPVLALGRSAGFRLVSASWKATRFPTSRGRRRERRRTWNTGSTAIRKSSASSPACRARMYMPHPFQIIQSSTNLQMVFEFANAQRTIHLTKMDPYPNVAYMGYSVGHWEGDTLVVDVSDFTDATWFDRAGNFHSDALHVIERFTPMGRDAIRYEATIDGQAGIYAPLEDQHAPLSPPGAECPAHGVPLRRDGGRDHVWASSQRSTGQTLGGQHHEC